MNRLELKAQFNVEDSGLITGIAWPFGTPDRIGDMIQPGAFKSAKTPLPLLAYHYPAKPVGVWNTITEKSDGLHVTAGVSFSLTLRTPLGRALLPKRRAA
jgi:phage head maturation protease